MSDQITLNQFESPVFLVKDADEMTISYGGSTHTITLPADGSYHMWYIHVNANNDYIFVDRPVAANATNTRQYFNENATLEISLNGDFSKMIGNGDLRNGGMREPRQQIDLKIFSDREVIADDTPDNYLIVSLDETFFYVSYP